MKPSQLLLPVQIALFSATGAILISGGVTATAQTTVPLNDPSPAETSLATDALPGPVMFNPPGGDAPRETRGGASRNGNSCFANGFSSDAAGNHLVGLIPESNYGLTLAERPVFFAYVPPATAETMMFTLSDEQGNVHYQTEMSIPDHGGVLQVPMPQAIAPLEMDTTYQWGFAVLCSGQLRPDSPFVTGWIQRIAPESDLAGTGESSLELAARYGESGIWYDALMTLAELRQNNPTDPQLMDIWAGFLNSANLGSIATAPLVEGLTVSE
jgi:hypothetical protein